MEKIQVPLSWPFDSIDCCITEAPDIIIVTVYRASGSKYQPVTGETRDLQDHHLLSKTAVHLEGEQIKKVVVITLKTTLYFTSLNLFNLFNWWKYQPVM